MVVKSGRWRLSGEQYARVGGLCSKRVTVAG